MVQSRRHTADGRPDATQVTFLEEGAAPRRCPDVGEGCRSIRGRVLLGRPEGPGGMLFAGWLLPFAGWLHLGGPHPPRQHPERRRVRCNRSRGGTAPKAPKLGQIKPMAKLGHHHAGALRRAVGDTGGGYAGALHRAVGAAGGVCRTASPSGWGHLPGILKRFLLRLTLPSCASMCLKGPRKRASWVHDKLSPPPQHRFTPTPPEPC